MNYLAFRNFSHSMQRIFEWFSSYSGRFLHLLNIILIFYELPIYERKSKRNKNIITKMAIENTALGILYYFFPNYNVHFYRLPWPVKRVLASKY